MNVVSIKDTGEVRLDGLALQSESSPISLLLRPSMASRSTSRSRGVRTTKRLSRCSGPKALPPSAMT